MIYVTCNDQEEAKTIASSLLENGLIACANILANHTAVYKWDGKVNTDAETGMLLKTQSDLYDAVEKHILEQHSYDTPCIVKIPLDGGHTPFLDWVKQQTDT